MELINFDNAATTFPKPPSVLQAASDAAAVLGGNAGRGGHRLSLRTSEAVYSARELIAETFGALPENVVFTLNCTHALNLAIQGIMSGGGHLIISGLEHNSAARPAAAMAAEGRITLSVAQVFPDDEQTVESFRSLIRRDTKAIVCTLASNVTGQLLPIGEIAGLCRERGICLIADGAQACGVIETGLAEGINILCTAGHKGLYGLSGTGLLISDGKFPIKPVIQGGTGNLSASLRQPVLLPEALESGTLNVPGILSLKAGVEFVRSKGTKAILAHESALCETFISSLADVENVTVYRENGASYAPIVSFNISGIAPEAAAAALAEKGFCLRAGLHCAPLAHANNGTRNGTVRFSPSVFSRRPDVLRLVKNIKELCSNK